MIKSLHLLKAKSCAQILQTLRILFEERYVRTDIPKWPATTIRRRLPTIPVILVINQ